MKNTLSKFYAWSGDDSVDPHVKSLNSFETEGIWQEPMKLSLSLVIYSAMKREVLERSKFFFIILVKNKSSLAIPNGPGICVRHSYFTKHNVTYALVNIIYSNRILNPSKNYDHGFVPWFYSTTN